MDAAELEQASEATEHTPVTIIEQGMHETKSMRKSPNLPVRLGIRLSFQERIPAHPRMEPQPGDDVKVR
ncbi:MAG: hypothetical protein OXI41_12450 [Chloroflexota bacterium]|nr:hypothetical protein [Chloroflexota bacterium]MDE2895109.1 hypothetical protein [Chloroflexota bacterium]